MATKNHAQQQTEARLDNLTLARKEGWQRFVNTAARIPPEPLTRTRLEALGEAASGASAVLLLVFLALAWLLSKRLDRAIEQG